EPRRGEWLPGTGLEGVASLGWHLSKDVDAAGGGTVFRRVFNKSKARSANVLDVEKGYPCQELIVDNSSPHPSLSEYMEEESNVSYALSFRQGWAWAGNFNSSDSSYGALDALTLRGGGCLEVSRGSNVSVAGNFSSNCDGTSTLRMTNGSILHYAGGQGGNLEINGVEVHLANGTLAIEVEVRAWDGSSAGNVSIGTDGQLRLGRSSSTEGSNLGQLHFNWLVVGRSGMVIIEDGSEAPTISAEGIWILEGGSITAKGCGGAGSKAGLEDATGRLPGESTANFGGGGGHAGRGG
ncbi:unnamed protein product, partial [Choristocarpus tenellus]